MTDTTRTTFGKTMKSFFEGLLSGAIATVVFMLIALAAGMGLRLLVWAFQLGWSIVP